MLKLAVVLAMMVGALATSGCIVEEQFACVGQKFVKCGHDWCKGDCKVALKESCDKKVLFRKKCELEDFCKEVKVPCGHDGNTEGGLFCSKGAKCIEEEECKLVRVEHVSKGYYGSRKKLDNGFVEICEKKFACGEVDPWALDAEAIEVECTKEYEVVDDMDCKALLLDASIFSKGLISKAHFLKMNHGKISCGEKLVGKLVCVEAEAKIKGETCSDGSVCDSGYECASKEVCSKVAVKKPVCEETPVFTCVTGSFGATLCGNKICSKRERCEIIAAKVCPVPLPVTGGAAGGVVVIPGKPAVTLPAQPGVAVTLPAVGGGQAVGGQVVGGQVVGGVIGGGVIGGGATGGGVIGGGVIGGGVIGGGVIGGGAPVPTPPAPVAAPGFVFIDGVQEPLGSAVSVSQADGDGVFVGLDSVGNDPSINILNDGQASNDAGTFGVGFSDTVDGLLITDADASTDGVNGDTAEVQSDGQINQVVDGTGQVLADAITDVFVSNDGVDAFADNFAAASGPPGGPTDTAAISTVFGTSDTTFVDVTAISERGNIEASTDTFSSGNRIADGEARAGTGR